MIGVLFALIAFASEPDDDPITRASAEELVDLARQRIEFGDHTGGQILLTQAIERDPAWAEEATYLAAASLELQREFAEAEAAYVALLDRFPNGARYADTRFRHAEVIASQGRFAEARERLTYLLPWNQYGGDDVWKLLYWDATWTLQDGQDRAGRKALKKLFKKAPPLALTYYRAKAHAVLARADVLAMADHPFTKKQGKTIRSYRKREKLLDRAEDHVSVTIALKEPEWVLEGLLVLGEGYERLGDDLLLAPIPPKLTPDQADLYTDILAEKVEPIWLKASAFYDEGHKLGLRLGWESHRVAMHDEHLHAVQDKIEALANP